MKDWLQPVIRNVLCSIGFRAVSRAKERIIRVFLENDFLWEEF